MNDGVFGGRFTSCWGGVGPMIDCFRILPSLGLQEARANAQIRRPGERVKARVGRHPSVAQ